mmetsp:Transcript_18854/g.50705  ORF Transcript_18854/g.50705 Transcript_18854/m.50705 type:complete len:218 (-) Transcript_18854:147-800(-)
MTGAPPSPRHSSSSTRALRPCPPCPSATYPKGRRPRRATAWTRWPWTSCPRAASSQRCDPPTCVQPCWPPGTAGASKRKARAARTTPRCISRPRARPARVGGPRPRHGTRSRSGRLPWGLLISPSASQPRRQPPGEQPPQAMAGAPSRRSRAPSRPSSSQTTCVPGAPAYRPLTRSSPWPRASRPSSPFTTQHLLAGLAPGAGPMAAERTRCRGIPT